MPLAELYVRISRTRFLGKASESIPFLELVQQ